MSARVFGDTPSLLAVNPGGKVFLRSFETDKKSMQPLNFPGNTSMIAAGSLFPNVTREVLIIASHDSLTAFDLFDNRELFYKDVLDGVTAIKTGFHGKDVSPLLFVGSNCSIQGFDHEGNERYWNITPDNVLSIALLDIDDDNSYELLTGCEDGQLVVFKDSNIMYEIDLHAPVISLCSFGIRVFG